MAIFNDTAHCYYSQIVSCPQISGWLMFTQLFLAIDYMTIVLGLYCTHLSISVRRARAERRGQPIPPYWKTLSFEQFLLLFTAATASNAIGVTLSATVGIRTMTLHVFQAGAAFLATSAIIVYIEMVLRSSMTKSRSILVLYKYFLPALFTPICLTCCLFVYQGFVSDYVQYKDASPTAKAMFSTVVMAGSMAWLFTFICIFTFLIVSRHSFRSYIRTIEGDIKHVCHFSGGNKSQTGGGGGMTSVGTGSTMTAGVNNIGMHGVPSEKPWHPQQQPQQHSHLQLSRVTNLQNGASYMNSNAAVGGDRQAEVIRALRNSVVTLGWLSMGCGILIAYSAFYGVVVMILGTPNVVYFLTLLVNYMTASLIALLVFLVNVVNLQTQGRPIGVLSSTIAMSSADTVEV
ncbi:hypothetical protein HK101_001470 [Irineochytrium annulatum]|nr:hypothetical protein HK101_001470 [Irineochytrium annulatum]